MNEPRILPEILFVECFKDFSFDINKVSFTFSSSPMHLNFLWKLIHTQPLNFLLQLCLILLNLVFSPNHSYLLILTLFSSLSSSYITPNNYDAFNLLKTLGNAQIKSFSRSSAAQWTFLVGKLSASDWIVDCIQLDMKISPIGFLLKRNLKWSEN